MENDNEKYDSEDAVNVIILSPNSNESLVVPVFFFNGNFLPYTHDTTRDRDDGSVILSKVFSKSSRFKERMEDASTSVVSQGIPSA